MTNPTTITATEASRRFSDFLNRVAYNGESFVIKKGSRVMAKIVPAEETRHCEEAVPTKQSSPMPKPEKSGSPRLQEQPRDDAQHTNPQPAPARQQPLDMPATAPSYASEPDYVSKVAAEMHKMLSS